MLTIDNHEINILSGYQIRFWNNYKIFETSWFTKNNSTKNGEHSESKHVITLLSNVSDEKKTQGTVRSRWRKCEKNRLVSAMKVSFFEISYNLKNKDIILKTACVNNTLHTRLKRLASSEIKHKHPDQPRSQGLSSWNLKNWKHFKGNALETRLKYDDLCSRLTYAEN